MKYFERKETSLIFRNNGEIVEICPWGKNSLRTRSVFMGEIIPGEIALFEPEKTEVQINIDERSASITNGNITAELNVVFDFFCLIPCR